MISLNNDKIFPDVLYHEFDDLTIINCTEYFNADKLSYLLQNQHLMQFNIVKTESKRSIRRIRRSIINKAKRLLIKSRHNKNEVSYTQSTLDDRYYSCLPISLQSLEGTIRDTIAKDYYNDFDISNAHPNILLYFTDYHNIKNDILKEYCLNRKKHINDFMMLNKDLKLSKDEVKHIFLMVLFGSNILNNNKYKLTKFIELFITEIKSISNYITILDREVYKKYEADYSIKNTNKTNVNFSYMSNILRIIENFILMELYHYLGKPKDCVLMFDGILLNKKKYNDLNSFNNYINTKFSMNTIKFVKKTFNKSINIPNNIDKYIYTELNYYSDKIKFTDSKYNLIDTYKNEDGTTISIVYEDAVKEWINNCLFYMNNEGVAEFIIKDINIFDIVNKVAVKGTAYSFIEANKFYNNHMHLNIINNSYKKGLLVDKYNNYIMNNPLSNIKLDKYIRMNINNDRRYKHLIKKSLFGKLNKNTGYIESIFTNELKHIRYKNYSKVMNKPFLLKDGDNYSNNTIKNIFSGYKYDLLQGTESKVIDYTKTNFYKHYNKYFLWSPKESAHFHQWIAYHLRLVKPSTKIHVFQSKSQGTGKSLMADFITKLATGAKVVKVSGFNALFDKFNVSYENRVFTIIEEIKNKGNEAVYDKIKELVATKSEHVEPKFGKKRFIEHFSGYIGNSNGKMYRPTGDRRLQIHDVNPNIEDKSWINNPKVFNPIIKELDNDDFYIAAFRYYSNLDIDEDFVRSVLYTDVIKEETLNSISIVVRWFKDYIQNNYYDKDRKNNTYKQLNIMYDNFTSLYGNSTKITAFKKQIKKITTIVRLMKNKKRNYYITININAIESSLKEILNDDNFIFNFECDEIDDSDVDFEDDNTSTIKLIQHSS